MDSNVMMGPMARLDLLENIQRQVQQSVKEGGKILYGGKRLKGGEYGNGHFYQPTVIEIDRNNILAREEAFGPIFAIL